MKEEQKEVDFLERDRPVDLGLSTKLIEAVRHVLKTLKADPNYPQGYDLALKSVLDRQQEIAELRETEQQLKNSQIALTRRSVLRFAAGGVGLGLVALAGAGLYSCIDRTYLTPEAVARRAEEDRINQDAEQHKKEQEMQNKIAAEDARILGLAPSAISEGGFRFHYPPLDKNISYTEAGGELGYFAAAKNDYFIFKQKNDGEKVVSIETRTYLDTYTRVKDGKKVPALVSRVGTDKYDRHPLRDQSSEEIDTSVVIFEDVNNHKEYIFAITAQDDLSFYQFRLMKKEPIN